MTKEKTKKQISRNKKYINAIITSDNTFNFKEKNAPKLFKGFMWAYAVLIFTITSTSLSLLAIGDQIQSTHPAIYTIIETVVVLVLLLDFILRWYTSPVRIHKGALSYILFPFTITSIVLLASLLPSLYLVNVWGGTHITIFTTFGALKFLRIFRIIILANLVPGLSLFKRVLQKEKSTLYTVFGLVIIAIILFSLVIYNIESIENDNIGNFFDAIYFSTITLTTIGFGDISPVTTIGETVVIVMSILGVAILAIPSGVIAGGFITELKIVRKEKSEYKEEKEKEKNEELLLKLRNDKKETKMQKEAILQKPKSVNKKDVNVFGLNNDGKDNSKTSSTKYPKTKKVSKVKKDTKSSNKKDIKTTSKDKQIKKK